MIAHSNRKHILALWLTALALSHVPTHLAAAASEEVSAAIKSVQDAAASLSAIEESLEQSEPEDSPLALAKARFLKAQKVQKSLVDSIVDSSTYKAELNKLGEPGQRSAKAVAELRDRLVTSDERVAAAAAEFAAAREEYQSLRTKLFQDDENWRNANENLKSLRRMQKIAESEERRNRAVRDRAEDQAKRAEQAAFFQELIRRQAEIDKARADASAKSANNKQGGKKKKGKGKKK